jgi:hypothetical protein
MRHALETVITRSPVIRHPTVDGPLGHAEKGRDILLFPAPGDSLEARRRRASSSAADPWLLMAER